MKRFNLIDSLPVMPSAEFFAEEENFILSPNRGVVLTYDACTSTGMVYYRALGQWIITTPITFPEFALQCSGHGLVLREGDATMRWARACAGQTSIGARH